MFPVCKLTLDIFWRNTLDISLAYEYINGDINEHFELELNNCEKLPNYTLQEITDRAIELAQYIRDERRPAKSTLGSSTS